jgi:diguanylate cyclase (GGDEF)-like protein/PAS domain S-box-containing protein
MNPRVPPEQADRGRGQQLPSGADPDGALTGIARLAAIACGADFACIFSEQAGVLSAHNLPLEVSDEMISGFVALLGVGEEFICADLAVDARFATCELVQIASPLRSCAVIPISPQPRVSLFIMGQVPKPLDQTEIESLRDLARLARRELERGPARVPASIDLDASLHRYRDLFDSTTDIVFTHDLGGIITAVNSTACFVSGYSREELLGLAMIDWVDASSTEALRHMLLEQFGGGSSRAYNLRLGKKGGGYFAVEMAGHLLFERGQPVGLRGFARDLTRQNEERSARRRAEAALDEQGCTIEQLSGYLHHLYRLDQTQHEDLVSLAEDCLRTGCSVLNMDAGYVFEMKPGSQEADLTHPVAGYSHRSGCGELNLRQLGGVLSIDKVGLASTLDASEGDVAVEVASCPIKVANRNWGILCLVRSQIPERGFGGEHFLSLLGAHLGERLTHEELSVVRRDPLTDLLNGSAFTLRLHRQLKVASSSKETFGLALFDLDLLNHFNQRYGFEAGDELLREIGQRLRNVSIEGEVVGRLGADRFAVIIPEVNTSAEERGRCFMEAVRKPVVKPDHQVATTVSVGVSLCPAHATGVQSLFRCADRALLQVKASGRNALALYSPSMDEKERAGTKIEAGLHTALADDEFLVNYQPQTRIDGSLRGFEALVAWNHPDRGLIRAGQFVPRAEETGLIIPIGEWVLREVGRQMASWRDTGFDPVTVAVNVSVLQFERPSFSDLVAEVLDEYRLDPEYVELEVTESALMRDTAQSTRVMHRLRELGVQLSIDDFGTGYSSLSYLNRLPVHALKIDRSFVEEAEKPENTLPTLQAVVNLAHSLGLTVVGEGVERLSQLRLLEQAGCDVIQGHLFGRPFSADSATQMLAKRQAALERLKDE